MTATLPPTSANDRPTILVIDDELGPRESLRFLLKEEYRVCCADSVDSGLAVLREQHPDTVIMDIRMPGRSGIEGLRDIRSIDADVAVIMLTGFAAIGTAQEAIRLEASDYMEKPFDASDMRQTVRRHVEQTCQRRKRRKLLEDAASLSHRMDAVQDKDWLANLGQSSAEFVHDLRNAIAASSGSLSLLRMEVESIQTRQAGTPSPDADQYLTMLEQAMHRCVDLLDTWQRLIRHDPVQRMRVNLHEFVSTCVTAGRSAHSTAVELRHEAIGPDMQILADRAQLSRVLFNLIQNAYHAFTDGPGLIRVQSERLGEAACIRIQDNGCGIAPEHLPRLFKPHFTTRSQLGGMGLGLFIAKKIVQAHGGAITADSPPGQGTTFTISLPPAPAVSDAPPA